MDVNAQMLYCIVTYFPLESHNTLILQHVHAKWPGMATVVVQMPSCTHLPVCCSSALDLQKGCEFVIRVLSPSCCCNPSLLQAALLAKGSLQ